MGSLSRRPAHSSTQASPSRSALVGQRDQSPRARHGATSHSNHVAIQPEATDGEHAADAVASRVSRSVAVLPTLTVAPRNLPLPATWRRSLEPIVGADLAPVRIHADDEAARHARAERAQAFAFGEEITFGRGQLRPDTRSGVNLIAHELAHVLQQRNSTSRVTRRAIGGSSSPDATSEPVEEPKETGGFSPLVTRSQPTLVFRGVDLVEDKARVRAALVHNFLAQGIGGLKAAWAFRAELSRQTFSPTPTYEIVNAKVGDNNFARRVEGVVQDVLFSLSREDYAFVEAFEEEAKLVLGRLMEASKRALLYHRGYFASSGEDNRLYTVAAREQQANSQALIRDKAKIERAAGQVAWHGDIERAGRLRGEIPKRIRAYHDATQGIYSSAPWLRGVKYGDLGDIAKGDFTAVIELIDAQIKGCDTVRKGGGGDAWMLPTVVQATLDLRKIPYDSRWAYAVGWRIHSSKRFSEDWRFALGIFQMLCYIAAPFTGGASLIPAAAISVFQAGDAALQFDRDSTLHDAGLAPAPSALGLALALAGAALDVGAAAAPAKRIGARILGVKKLHVQGANAVHGAPSSEPIKAEPVKTEIAQPSAPDTVVSQHPPSGSSEAALGDALSGESVHAPPVEEQAVSPAKKPGDASTKATKEATKASAAYYKPTRGISGYGSVANLSAIDEIRAIFQRRTRLIRLRNKLIQRAEALGVATPQRAKTLSLVRGQISEASRLIGEVSAESIFKELGATRLYPAADAIHGTSLPNEFDQIWELEGEVFIVDGKGGSGATPTRPAAELGRRTTQFTPEYIASIVGEEMLPKPELEGLVRKILDAYQAGRLRYIKVHVPLRSAAGDVLEGYKVVSYPIKR